MLNMDRKYNVNNNYDVLKTMLINNCFEKLNELCIYNNFVIVFSRCNSKNNILISFKEFSDTICNYEYNASDASTMLMDNIVDLLMLFINIRNGTVLSPNNKTVKEVISLRIKTINTF
jgi:hypothetical protein